MGTTTLKGFKKIIEILKTSGIREVEDLREIRSIGMEIMRR